VSFRLDLHLDRHLAVAAMVYNGGELSSHSGFAFLTGADEVSGIVVDFGSHTTRAGYAGEDCPRVVCTSFYGYTSEPSSSGTNGDGGVSMDGQGEGKKGSRRTLYVGDDGVGVWRAGMEVDNFMTDGVGMSVPS